MPKWIHDRAQHLRDKNPEMTEQMSYALATQQAHASGKSPKGYGTKKGRKDAKKKYSKRPGEYEGKAAPKTEKEASLSARSYGHLQTSTRLQIWNNLVRQGRTFFGKG